MRQACTFGVSALVLGMALGLGSLVDAQDRVKVEVTVPAVPNVGLVAPTQPSTDTSTAPRGMVYLGYRGAYHIAGSGQESHAMFRDANNQFWSTGLTYYGISNGYWIAAVNGAPDTFLAFQATPSTHDAPYFKVLIHTPATAGYAAFDEATRGNAQNAH